MEQLSLFHQDTKKTRLTKAQIQVAVEVAKQKTNKEVADTLGKSESTVESQLKDIQSKTGCHNRVGVAIAAIVEGHITPEEALKAAREE